MVVVGMREPSTWCRIVPQRGAALCFGSTTAPCATCSVYRGARSNGPPGHARRRLILQCVSPRTQVFLAGRMRAGAPGRAHPVGVGGELRA
jgi:hypothetical protein